jgi:hypothetical protein
MDLLIVGGIAMLGYELNKKKNKSPRKGDDRQEGIYEKYPLESSHEIEKNKKNMQERMNRHFNDPKTIGDHNLKPFFKSEKTQNTNNDFKDRRLSMFTGNNNIEFAHKKETFTMFNPQKDYDVRGSKAQRSDIDRYVPTDIQTNVLPFEQIKVGRGIGIQSDVSASGGFHSHFRIKPNNVNDYRKNQFENRVIVGRSLQEKIDKHTVGHVQDYDKTVYQCQRPTMPIKSMVEARQTRSDNKDIQKSTSRGISQQDGVGASYFPGAQQTIKTEITRLQDSTKNGFIGNPVNEGLRSTQNESAYIINNNERGTCMPGDVFTNVHGQATGGYNIYDDEAKSTLRQCTTYNNYTGPANGQFPSNGSNPAFKNNTPKNVKRQFTSTCTDPNGIISTAIKADTSRVYDASCTKRELINKSELSKGHTIQGVKSVPYTLDHQQYRSSIGHELNKESTNYSFTPNMSRVNNTSDALYSNGSTFLKNDQSNNTIKYQSQLPSMNNHTQAQNLGSVQLDEDRSTNNRLDFGIYNKQYKQNPYNNDILKKSLKDKKYMIDNDIK